MKLARVMVTGGRGLLGEAVVRCLLGVGMEVMATYRSEPGANTDANWIQADLRDERSLRAVRGVDAVVHTAAVLPRVHDESDAAAHTNRRIDAAVFEAARRWDATLIYISGVSVYGKAKPVAAGFREADRPRPIGAYLAEKVTAEQWGHKLAGGPIRFTALRVSAPYGTGQRTHTVLRTFVERAARGETLYYWGTGARRQDFVHADDVARACQAALGGPGGTFNIASGDAVTMRGLAELVAAAARLPPSSVQAACKLDPGEKARADYSIDLAREMLGWEPTIALRQGVEEWLGAIRRVSTA